ncbi:methyltransferase [Rubrivivax albus]|uniref:Methyltransferase domain-containing protein n=1 Tax=Rubrivivax albus TaxID=2499835 RepID=A0A3S2U267_9BURK|nr:methyltransferase [Rubrivivax albus]RVT50780.1 methyltransferase domain-containing protein [Rubrivivax albus]
MALEGGPAIVDTLSASPTRRPDRGASASGWLQVWRERWRDWRNRMVADPAFQRRAAAFGPTRRFVRRDAAALFDLMAGFVYSQVLLSCVRLRLFERLADGPCPVPRLVQATGLDEDALRRLLAAAVAVQLLDWRQGDRVALGRLGAPLPAQPGLLAMVEHHATLYADLADPLALLRRDRPAAMAAYWPYADHGAATAQLAATDVAAYSELMTASQALVTQEVLAAYDLRAHRVLLDVGGGEGAFLVAAAQTAPQLSVRLFDLPAVAQRAQARFDAAGLQGRSRTHGGDFFNDPLPTGADVVSLVRVAFDHPDHRVLQLLRNVRRALPPGGCLLLAEPMAGERGAEAMGDAYFGLYLLAMGRGRPRTADELSALMREAGFTDVRRVRTRMPLQTGLLVAR